MPCDIPGNFLPASYKGVPFYIESAEKTGGRRLAKHEYPNSESWYVEDLGVDTPTFKGTAYLASDGSFDGVYADSEALFAACNEGGSGSLVLPPDIFTIAQCDSVTRKFEKDKQGFIAFDLEFIGDDVGFGGAPFTVGAALAARLIAQALVSIIDIVADAGVDFFAAERPSYDAREAASDNIRLAVAVIDTAASRAVPLPERAGETPILFDALMKTIDTYDLSSTSAAPAAYGAVVEAFSNYAISAIETTSQPRVIADNLQKAILPAIAQPEPVGRATFVGRVADTAYSLEVQSAIAQTNAFTGVLCGMVMAQGYADAAYGNRRDAQITRGRMVATLSAVISQMSPQNPGVEYLILARNQAAKAIADKMARLKPTQVLEFNRSLPAPYIAWRLYRDPARSEELAELNSVPHPMFMPSKIEAEASDAQSNRPPRQR